MLRACIYVRVHTCMSSQGGTRGDGERDRLPKKANCLTGKVQLVSTRKGVLSTIK